MDYQFCERLYSDGERTGRNWKFDYIPGGPEEGADIYLNGFRKGLKSNRYKNLGTIKRLLSAIEGGL